MSPWMAKQKTGSRILISPPSGNFFSKKDEKAFWIAAGTGIAPFLSMHRSNYSSRKTLIHGSRTLQGFFSRHELSRALGKNYIPCSSGEAENGIYPGRLTRYLRELKSLDPDIKYYLCGSAEMVVETRDLLLLRGVAFDNITSEIYF